MKGPGLAPLPKVRFCHGCDTVYPLVYFADSRCRGCRAERTAERLEQLLNDPFITAAIRETPRGESAADYYRALVAQGISIRAIAVHVGLGDSTVSRAMSGRAGQYKAVNKARGKCADCGASGEGKTRCPKHREMHAAREARRRAAQ